MVENKAFDAEGDPRDLTLSARPITPQSQTGSNQNQIAILVLGAFVAVSLVGLVAVLVVHVQAGEQWEQEIDNVDSEKARLSEDLNEKTSEIAKLTNTLNGKTSEISKLVDNLNDKTSENSQLAAGLQKAQEEVAELKTKTTGWDQINTEKIQLNKTLMNKTAESRLQNHSEIVTKLKLKLVDRLTAYENLVAEKVQLTSAWQKARDEVTELQRQKDALENQTNKLDDELAKSRAKVEELEVKIKSIPCQISCDDVTLREVTIPGSTTKRNVSMDGDWTVIQRRMNGCQTFTKDWKEYVAGFGSPCAEYWLGLEAIHQLTKNGDHLLRIDLVENGSGVHYYAQYSSFKLEPSADKYILRVSGYSGNATDALAGLGAGSANAMKFSTYDSNNGPLQSANCADGNGAGWWQNSCSNTALNGKYGYGDWNGVVWVVGSRRMYSSFVEMKIRKK